MKKLVKQIESIVGKKFNQIFSGDFETGIDLNNPDEYEMVLRDMGVKIKITKIS